MADSIWHTREFIGLHIKEMCFIGHQCKPLWTISEVNKSLLRAICERILFIDVEEFQGCSVFLANNMWEANDLHLEKVRGISKGDNRKTQSIQHLISKTGTIMYNSNLPKPLPKYFMTWKWKSKLCLCTLTISLSLTTPPPHPPPSPHPGASKCHSKELIQFRREQLPPQGGNDASSALALAVYIQALF